MGSSRRGFLGACFAGAAGLVLPKCRLATVERKLAVPEDLADEVQCCDSIEVRQFADARFHPDSRSILGHSARDDVWFGLSQDQLDSLSLSQYTQLITAHLDVNRKLVPFFGGR